VLLLIEAPLVVCCSSTGGIAEEDEGTFEKKSKLSEGAVFFCVIFALVEFTEAGIDKVSNPIPNKSALDDGTVTFFPSVLEFLGECGFGRGEGIAMFTGDAASFVGSGMFWFADTPGDFFFRF
jgi:hypothetical protein